jgi:hypothetical protein
MIWPVAVAVGAAAVRSITIAVTVPETTVEKFDIVTVPLTTVEKFETETVPVATAVTVPVATTTIPVAVAVSPDEAVV